MSDRTILTIILNYKTPDLTLRSANAARTAMIDLAGEITIVDNNSQDGSFEKIKSAIEGRGWDKGTVPVRIIQSGNNGGFGAGNNFGIRAQLSNGSSPNFYYILNSDAFPEPDAIKALLAQFIKAPETGICGSYIKGSDGETHLTTFRFPSIFSEFEESIRFGPVTRILKRFQISIPTPSHVCPVDWVAGASFMVRREMLDQVGLFDENFFLYFEETDLCLRASRAGWRTDFVPQSIVTHIGSASTGMGAWERVPIYWFDSRFYYFTKNHGRLYAAGTTVARLVGGSMHELRCRLTNRDRGVPKKFLRTLLVHDIQSAVGNI